MAITGLRPSILSTSGRFISPTNWRAYAEKVSMYLLWPSAKRVSNARLDFPLPLKPVNTTNLCLGISRSIFLRLCSLAPIIFMVSCSLIIEII